VCSTQTSFELSMVKTPSLCFWGIRVFCRKCEMFSPLVSRMHHLALEATIRSFSSSE
jgi:hypothetical protein